MILFLVEAALRSVLLALAVWAVLRIFSVRNVLAQKAAWGLVLAAALCMPMVLRMAAHLPAPLVIPARQLHLLDTFSAAPTSATKIPASDVADPVSFPSAAPSLEVQTTAPVHAKAMAKKSSVERRAADSVSLAAEDSGAVSADRYPAPSMSNSGSTPTVPNHASQPWDGSTWSWPSLLQLAGLAYLAIAGILFLRLLFGLAVAIDVWVSAKPVLLDSSPLIDGLHLRVSDAICSPVTIGSAVVLPADYADWDSEKLRIVLAHERSHVRQGDFYLQLLAGVYAATFWVSPLGWWLKRKLSDLAEAISDRAGLEEAASRSSYAQILLEFAAAPRPTLIGVAMARNGSLTRRIERLLNDVSFRQAFAGTRRGLVAVLLIPVALIAATSLVRVDAAGQQAPTPPTPAAAPTGGVPAPEAVVAPAAPSSGLAVPEQVSGELPEPAMAGEPPAIPPAPPAVAAPPATAIAPPAQAGAPGTALAPLPPVHASTPEVLMIAPAAPAHGKLMIISPKAPMPGPGSMMILPPAAPGSPRRFLAIVPGHSIGEGRGYGVGAGQDSTRESGSQSYSNNGKHSGYHYSSSSNGESYAIIRGGDYDHMTFSGSWIDGRRAEFDKARKQAHGDFLWFTRDGKSYFVDDPSTLSQIEAMYKPMEGLGAQQEALGKRQEELGKQQEELGRQQEAVSVPTPDMSREMAKVNEAMAQLKASEGKSLTQEQFGEMQERLAELQARLGEMQGQIGARQGEFGERMGKLGAMQGELGAQQGKLGAEQGRIAQEADRKIKGIIDESLKNGKAHPVQ